MPLSRILAILAAYSLLLTCARSASSQNMPHEAGFLFAVNGQAPLITSDNVNRGFYTNPTIAHGYYSFLTNGLQSLSLFVEHVSERRGWSGIWSDRTSIEGGSANFQATVSERLQMTTIGLETVRTLISESGFRLGAGLGIGFGLGGASADVTNVLTAETTTHDSFATWDALLLTAQIRARYTIFTMGDAEIGVVLIGRYWGFPFIGPLGTSGVDYNGPDLRVLSEFGYLAGVSVGF